MCVCACVLEESGPFLTIGRTPVTAFIQINTQNVQYNNPSITGGGEDEGLDLELHHLKTATVKVRILFVETCAITNAS